MVAKILPLQLKLAEQVRVSHVIADLDPAVPRADLLKPEAWRQLVPRLHIGDRIECLPRDMSWYADLQSSPNASCIDPWISPP